jgi:hypothetical protein
VSAADGRRLVLVVGVGRSGTSLLTGVLGQVGFHIPRPEVDADETNPRGFSEPQWVVDFHRRLLRARRITVNDSRPSAWASTYGAANDRAAVAELHDWLAGELAQGAAVAVKDPRTVWFLPLWVKVAGELGVPTSFVTMLRHPAEVLRSALKSYGTAQTPASRTAAWINVALETERLTRGDRRAFVRHQDLLADWRRELARTGELLDLPLITGGIAPERAAAVDDFVDPGLHRHRVQWEDLDVPERLRDLAEQAWARLQPLADPGGDAAPAQAELDTTRAAFVALHEEAEAIAQSAIKAARRSGGRGGARKAPRRAPLRVRVARRIPKRYRRGLRRLLGRTA